MLIGRPKIGDIIPLHPFVNLDKKGETEKGKIPGTVVYVNYEHRFFTAEFVFPRGKFRESFKFATKEDLKACPMHYKPSLWLT